MITKKIIVVHKNLIDREPPTQMVVQHLCDLGYTVTLITVGSNDFWSAKFKQLGVEVIDLKLGNLLKEARKSKLKRISFWLRYRSRALSEIKKISTGRSNDVLFWFVNADSLAPLIFSKAIEKQKFIFHLLEMYDNSNFYKQIIKKYSRIAEKIVVCEENRAAVFNVWFQPKQYPTVLPNKPYSLINVETHNTLVQDFLPQDLLADKKIILYQGWIGSDRDLSFILEAVNLLGEEYLPVLMGEDTGMVEKYKKICPSLIHINYIPSPLHLHITAKARYGILIYDPLSLNQIFCAPNKIFEYAGYGIPMIGNHIPGLNDVFNKYDCGKTFIEKKASIVADAILEMEKEYDQYSQNSLKLYNDVDCKKIIQDILIN